MAAPLKWKRLEWEENGKQYSCWKLNTSKFPVLMTGDGGKKEYDKLFNKEGN